MYKVKIWQAKGKLRKAEDDRLPQIDYPVKMRVALFRMNGDNDLKTEGALNERQVTKVLHNILSVNSEAGVTFKAVYHRHKQIVLKILHESVLNCFCLHWS